MSARKPKRLNPHVFKIQSIPNSRFILVYNISASICAQFPINEAQANNVFGNERRDPVFWRGRLDGVLFKLIAKMPDQGW